MPSKLEEDEASTQEEFYSYQVYYNNIDKTMQEFNIQKSKLRLSTPP
jgi:hypothetical protein